MPFIGNPIDTQNTFQSLVGKRFNGDGSTTAFTLDVAPSSTLDIEVFVGNVRQDPNSAYTVSGTTLSFTGAPPSGTNNIYVVHQAKSVGTIDPPANSVGVTQLNLSDGSSGQFIKTDGSGTLSFASVSSAADDITAGDSAINLTTTSGNITIDAQAGDSDIIFKGTDGSSDITALTIDMSDAGILNVKSGIKFPATQVASSDDNTLDDYEVGTFTPVLGGAGGTSGQSYGLQAGNYVKIGDRVFIDANTSLSTKGTITGNLQVQGLPFTSKSGSAYRASASHSYIHTWSLSSGETQLNSLIYDNTAVIALGESDVTGAEAWSALTTSQVNNASEINTSVNYRVA
jgi:hypothetical protein